MDKSPEAFRTISEVAELLDIPAHVLRFWESRFAQIRPVKRAGGRRYYRPGDVALLAGIRVLLHDRGVTIRGVQKILRERGVRQVAQLGAGLLGGGAPGDLAEALAADLAPEDLAGAAGAGDAAEAAPEADPETDDAAAPQDAAAGVTPGEPHPPVPPAPVTAPIMHPAAVCLSRPVEGQAALRPPPVAGDGVPGGARAADTAPGGRAPGSGAAQNLPRVHAVIRDLFGRTEAEATPPRPPPPATDPAEGPAAIGAPRASAARDPARPPAAGEPAAAPGSGDPDGAPAPPASAPGVAVPDPAWSDPAVPDPAVPDPAVPGPAAPPPAPLSVRLGRLPPAALVPEAAALAAVLSRAVALRDRLVAARDDRPGRAGQAGARPDGA